MKTSQDSSNFAQIQVKLFFHVLVIGGKRVLFQLIGFVLAASWLDDI